MQKILDRQSEKIAGRVFRCASLQLTLFIMLICVPIFLPIVLAYTAFALRVMRARVRLTDIERHHSRH